MQPRAWRLRPGGEKHRGPEEDITYHREDGEGGKEASIQRAQPGEVRRQAAVLQHARACTHDDQRKGSAKRQPSEYSPQRGDGHRWQQSDADVDVQQREQRDYVADEARWSPAP